MLKSSDTNKLRSGVLRNTPPRVFMASRGGLAFSVKGYLKLASSPSNLDALGIHMMDGTVHLSEGALRPGDELDGAFVVWEPHRDSTFTSYVLRKIPDFLQWTLHGFTDGGTDGITGEPIQTPADTLVDVYVARYAPRVQVDMSGSNSQTRATVVTRSGALSPGDEVSHAQYGTFTVVSVIPYGPYEQVELGGS